MSEEADISEEQMLSRVTSVLGSEQALCVCVDVCIVLYCLFV